MCFKSWFLMLDFLFCIYLMVVNVELNVGCIFLMLWFGERINGNVVLLNVFCLGIGKLIFFIDESFFLGICKLMSNLLLL